MTKFGLALFAAILAATMSYAAAPPDKESDPLKGVVVGNDVVTCTGDGESSMVYVYLHSLRHDTKVRGRWCAGANRSPIRWQIGYGAFWVSQDTDFTGLNRPPRAGGGILERIDLALLFKEGKIFNRLDAHFSGETPARTLSFPVHSSKYFLYFDYLPAGKRLARQFITTNVTGKRLDEDRDFRKGKSPPCTFSSYISDSPWDAKKERWVPKPWALEWSTPAAFEEPFQALALGDDFYFVTRSGAMFRAAKPAKGTDRVLTRVWDGRLRPIKAFVSDAKTGKTFLFVPPAEEGGKRAFFELSDKPKLVEYDPKLVPMPPLEEPHRTILHHARVLVALKKIKGEPAPKGK